jgi:hypothetical protein
VPIERSTPIILTANSESIPRFLVSFQDLAWETGFPEKRTTAL